eukprot:7452886-Prorocentrum_lima.AAC.1
MGYMPTTHRAERTHAPRILLPSTENNTAHHSPHHPTVHPLHIGRRRECPRCGRAAVRAVPLRPQHCGDDPFASLSRSEPRRRRTIPPSIGPVSYTHLTLPTICSV